MKKEDILENPINKAEEPCSDKAVEEANELTALEEADTQNAEAQSVKEAEAKDASDENASDINEDDKAEYNHIEESSTVQSTEEEASQPSDGSEESIEQIPDANPTEESTEQNSIVENEHIGLFPEEYVNGLISAALPEEIEEEPEAPEKSDNKTLAEVDADVKEKKEEEAPLPSPAEEKIKQEEKSVSKRTAILGSAFDFLEMFVFTLVAVLVITCFLIRPSVVSGDSMQDTLEDKQVLLVSDLFYTPRRGDVIVVEDYATTLKKPIVKRVIGIEGDIVRVTKDAIYVNGERLEEPYVRIDFENYTYTTWYIDCFSEKHNVQLGRDYYEITVPEGELFILGDHRNASKDSREIGTVDADAVIGRVLIRILPFNSFGAVE